MTSLLPAHVAVRAEGLGKIYRVLRGPVAPAALLADEDEVEGEDDLQDDLDTDAPRAQRMVALRDVSFTLVRGLKAGLVGDSGAGKTSLLRILGRTVAPTSGRVVVRGPVVPPVQFLPRMFEPQLTGRANLRLVADLLGLPAPWADAHVGEVAAMAGLERHMHLELLRWPSGFPLRLAQAVALTGAPGVVLSEGSFVGTDRETRDIMGAALDEQVGRGTTLLISCRDGKALRATCDIGIWLEDGALRAIGPASTIATEFEAAGPRRAPSPPEAPPDAGKADRAVARRQAKRERADRRSQRRAAAPRKGVAAGPERTVATSVELVAAEVRPSAPVRFGRAGGGPFLLARIDVLRPVSAFRCGVAVDTAGRRKRVVAPSTEVDLKAGSYEAVIAIGAHLRAGSHRLVVRVEHSPAGGADRRVVQRRRVDVEIAVAATRGEGDEPLSGWKILAADAPARHPRLTRAP